MGKWGLRMCDLVDPETLREKLAAVVPVKQRIVAAYGGTEVLDAEALYREYAEYGKRLAPFVTDTSVLLDGQLRRGKRVLFEGAQGTHLCIDHGIYPYGTSSNCTAGAAATGPVGAGACGAGPCVQARRAREAASATGRRVRIETYRGW